ncbi:hypothetical protein OAK35_00390 [Crocinitomicaceae bacterium]|nr:hypothetical protein [Crocinitomicaceae bacterium]
MKHLILLTTLFVTTLTFAGQKELEIQIYRPDSVKVDSNLGSKSMVYFSFPNANDLSGTSITYSFDDVEGEHSLITNQGDLKLETIAESHSLQFYYSPDYYEEYGVIHIEAGKHYYFSINFTPAEMMILTEKPVIYLYPQEERNVQVKVNPAGEFTFTYPKYENGWDVLASPDGKLIVDDQSYNYLFWEASEQLSIEEIDFNTGFTVPGLDVTAFLEEKLTDAGLNGTERADFITFWGPRMASHEDVFLQFKFNEECDQFGELEIEPKPDNVYRIYVVWQPIDQLRIAPRAQEIPVMNREGFTVLEWGGQELPSTTMVRTL